MGQFEQRAEQGWGMWRRFIAHNPLTGSWISFAAGVVVGWAAYGVL